MQKDFPKKQPPYELTQCELDTINFLQSICEDGYQDKMEGYVIDLMRIAYITGWYDAGKDELLRKQLPLTQ